MDARHDYPTPARRLGQQIRNKRRNPGFTQADLASLSRLTRQKIITVEQGSLSVAMNAYARVLAALDCKVTVVPAVIPTLDEVQDLFERENVTQGQPPRAIAAASSPAVRITLFAITTKHPLKQQ